jgi:hypothetical protein
VGGRGQRNAANLAKIFQNPPPPKKKKKKKKRRENKEKENGKREWERKRRMSFIKGN